MSFPVASIAVYNSVVFGVFSNTERFLSRHRCGEPEAGPGRSLSDLLLASMVAGMISVGLGGPAELIKIRLQMQTQPFREGKRPMGENPVLRTRDLSALGWIWGAGHPHPVNYKLHLHFLSRVFHAALESGFYRGGRKGRGARCVSALVESGARGDKGAGQALCVHFGGVRRWGRPYFNASVLFLVLSLIFTIFPDEVLLSPYLCFHFCRLEGLDPWSFLSYYVYAKSLSACCCVSALLSNAGVWLCDTWETTAYSGASWPRSIALCPGSV